MVDLTRLLSCNHLPKVIVLVLLDSLAIKTYKKIPMVLAIVLTKTTRVVILLVSIDIADHRLIFGLRLVRAKVTLPLVCRLILITTIRMTWLNIPLISFSIKSLVVWIKVTRILALALVLRRSMIYVMRLLMFTGVRILILAVRRIKSLREVITTLIVRRQIIVNIRSRVNVVRPFGWYK